MAGLSTTVLPGQAKSGKLVRRQQIRYHFTDDYVDPQSETALKYILEFPVR